MNINTINTTAKDAAPIEITRQAKVLSQNSAAKDIQNMQTQEKTKEKQNSILSAKETKELTEEMNDLMDDLETNLGFSIREGLNRQVVVEIKNRNTNELIRQIPSEELLKIKEKMVEFTGLIFNQEA